MKFHFNNSKLREQHFSTKKLIEKYQISKSRGGLARPSISLPTTMYLIKITIAKIFAIYFNSALLQRRTTSDKTNMSLCDKNQAACRRLIEIVYLMGQKVGLLPGKTKKTKSHHSLPAEAPQLQRGGLASRTSHQRRSWLRPL